MGCMTCKSEGILRLETRVYVRAREASDGCVQIGEYEWVSEIDYWGALRCEHAVLWIGRSSFLPKRLSLGEVLNAGEATQDCRAVVSSAPAASPSTRAHDS